MKKNVVFAVAVLTAATIFAQEKKAVIGMSELTTTLSEATVEGYWGEYWGGIRMKREKSLQLVVVLRPAIRI